MTGAMVSSEELIEEAVSSKLTHIVFDRVTFPTAVELGASLPHWVLVRDPPPISLPCGSLHRAGHNMTSCFIRVSMMEEQVPISYYLILNVTPHHFCCLKQTTEVSDNWQINNKIFNLARSLTLTRIKELKSHNAKNSYIKGVNNWEHFVITLHWCLFSF